MRRYVRPAIDANVWCRSGRWGPRRVRVTECWAVLNAEDVYTHLLRDDPCRTKPGARGSLRWTLPHEPPLTIAWELRSNAVWRFGRAFLRCPRCDRLSTRVYVPREGTWAACRRCWGLTYESRQQRTYRIGASYLSRAFGPLACVLTHTARLARAAAAERRYAERREILRRWGQSRTGF